MSKLKVLDLFSGIGGFSLGLERTNGFETIAFCEIEPFCRAVLRKHWPGIKIYEDVRNLDAATVSSADVICGGFPCQDISHAGKQVGIKGERSGLWWEVQRLIRGIRPRFAILENVSALLNTGFGSVVGSLAEIGYDAEWHCIPASYVGAPHIRDRVWIVAYPNEMGRKIRDEPITGRSLSRYRMDTLARMEPKTLPGDIRMVNGVSARVDANRIAACGNAVLPQIPEIIGRSILAA